MHEVLRDMQGQRGYTVPHYATQENTFQDPSQGNYYHDEEEFQSKIAGYQ